MNSISLRNAISDPNLYGDCLVVPLRLSTHAFRRAFSSLPADQRLLELFKRVGFFIASIGSIPAFPFACVGMSIKWMHLGWRINQLAHPGPAISYYFPMILEPFSRLGDRTVAYLNTKYIAEQYNLPVYFVPFKGCEIFQFSKDEQLTGHQYFKNVVHLKSRADIEALANVDRNVSTLYLLPFFPHTRNIAEEGPGCSYIDHTTDWPSFRPRVKELLKVHPVGANQEINLLPMPANVYSIALHIRDGGNYDDDTTKTLLPMKLPPIEFYLNRLTMVLNEHAPLNRPVFIHIFTDAVRPRSIYDIVHRHLVSMGASCPEEYKGNKPRRSKKKRALGHALSGSILNLQNRSIQLSYIKHASLVDDIANMSRFQCMIRADSNLSGPVCEGSDVLELEIFPTHCRIDPDWQNISVSQVQIVKNRNEVTNVETHYPRKVVQGGMPRWLIQKFQQHFGVLQSKPHLA